MNASTPPASPGRPFAAPFPVRSIDDVRRLESVPLAEAVPVRSTYELLRNSAAAFGERTALAFLRSADPADEPLRWSYAELLAGVHQTANLLHSLGVGPGDAVGVLLPGCLEYHLALWGGEAAAIVQPLNPLLSEEKLASLLRTSNAKVLDRLGRRTTSRASGRRRCGCRPRCPRSRRCCASRRTARRPRRPLPEGVGRLRRAARAASPTTGWRAAATSPAPTSPPTSTPAAPPARPSSPATATARRCSAPGPA